MQEGELPEYNSKINPIFMTKTIRNGFLWGKQSDKTLREDRPKESDPQILYMNSQVMGSPLRCAYMEQNQW